MPKTDEGAPGPAMIFLEPPCDSYAPEGRQWCEDDVWDEGGVPYVRSDLALRTPTGEAGEMVADSGMSGEAVERAEWAWANLPVGPRKWTSLATHEKALVCHTITRLSTTDTEAMRLLMEARNVLANSQAESGYCMCGDPVESHTIGSGHAPVDSHIYMAEQLIARIDALAKGGA